MCWPLLLLLAAPAIAQRPAGVGADTKALVVADYSEIRAGPGAAYISRGRVYEGDRVRVTKRSETGEWYAVTVGGVRGWVRARALEVLRDTVRRDADGKVDTGRDRRTTNYGYDETGRRRLLDGKAAGSGEGTDGAPGGARANTPAGVAPLEVRLSLAVTGMRRGFSSNIDPAVFVSALRDLEASTTGYGAELEVAWSPLPVLVVRGLYRDTRLASVTIPANDGFGFNDDFDVETSAQQVELDATGRWHFADVWAGGYLGGHLLRHAYQETAPFPVFLTNTFLALAAGGAGGWRLGPVEIGARAGLFFPLLVSQSPAEGGDASALGYQAAAEVAWRLHPRLAVVGHWHFLRVQTDYEGQSTHADTHGATPVGYTVAKETDTIHGGGLGVRWSPL